MNEAVPSSMGNLTQVALWLIVVVAFILVLAWLLRRFGGGALGGGQTIRVLAATSLGARDRLLLVDVAGKQLLLGASPGRITTLHEFDEPVAGASQPVPDHPFARQLQQRLRGQGGPDSGHGTGRD